MRNNKVIWLEGMFLQPQHFQQQDRFVEQLIHSKIRSIEPNFWGFNSLQIDTQLLSIGKIGLAEASGYFQDGTPFDFPEVDQLPLPFEIPEGLENTILYLAIPTRQYDETGDNSSKEEYRYRIDSTEIKDSTVGNDRCAEIQYGKLFPLILSEKDDKRGFHCLQFTRILESRANQQISLDKLFLPHCADVHACNLLYQIILEVHGLLSHRAEMLANRLTDTKQPGTAEIVDCMLLQLINRYEPIFYYLQHKSCLHPENLFYHLIQLVGEIATFTSNKRRSNKLPLYQHEKPYQSFQPVMYELRNALSTVLEQNATAIPLQDRTHGLWVGQFPEKQLISSASFVLAVYADLPLENIRIAFPSQVKIAPVEQIRTLVSRQLPGIELQAIPVAPRQIPYHSNFLYFSVNTRHELWLLLDKSAGIAFHIGNQFPGIKLELWAIKG